MKTNKKALIRKKKNKSKKHKKRNIKLSRIFESLFIHSSQEWVSFTFY